MRINRETRQSALDLPLGPASLVGPALRAAQGYCRHCEHYQMVRPPGNPVDVYDFNATLLHLLGLDHDRLSYYHNGIERRLTNVHGHVIKDVLA